MLTAIANAQNYAAGMSHQAFLADLKTIRAVAFEIAVIGEAARHMPAEIQSRYPEVPWSAMQGMRNRVIHEYFRIEIDTVWETLQQDLPVLAKHLRRLQQDQEAGDIDAP